MVFVREGLRKKPPNGTFVARSERYYLTCLKVRLAPGSLTITHALFSIRPSDLALYNVFTQSVPETDEGDAL